MCLAIPGEIVRVYEKDGIRFAEVEFGKVSREVCLHTQPDAQPGEFVLVHVGFAIATIDRERAARAWELIRELGEDESS